MAGKQPQQVKFLGGQGDVLAFHQQLAGVGVQAQALEFQWLAGLEVFLIDTPQYGVHARNHLLRTEGFDDVVIRPQIQAAQPVAEFAFSGEHNDRNAVGQADLAGQSQPIDARQHQVQHDQVRALVFDSI